jgi:TPR repeat protein
VGWLACWLALGPWAIAADAGAGDPAAQWQAFLAHGTADDVNAAVGAVDSVGYDGLAVDAGKCRAHATAVAEGLRRVPVSMVMQRVALLCAEATGDRAAADSAATALAALARDAFAEADRGAWPRPVRIVLPGDAYALFASAGMQVRYEIYPQLYPAPYFPMLVAAAPPEGGVETLVQFDYVDVLQQVDRKSPSHGTPRLRLSYVESFVGGAAKRGEVSALDYEAVKAASQEESPAKKVDALREAAGRGGLGAASTWLLVCRMNPSPGCADGLVDALLPQAEARHAYPMMLLALAYAEGVGVARDTRAAGTMLDAANRAWKRDGASVVYAEMMGVLNPGQPLQADVRKRLEAARDAGNATAAAMLVADRVEHAAGSALDPADEALLASAVNNTSGQGFLKLAGWYESRDAAKSDDYLRRAARLDNPAALRILAFRLRREQGSKPPTPETLAWFEKAANGGDLYAMNYSGFQAYMHGDPRRAEDWVLPAAVRGDADALFFVASLWAGGYRDMSGDAARAVEVYQSLAGSDEYGARARRELAGMALAGKGMAKDPSKAKAWLLQDAEAGDAESQAYLGSLLLNGTLGVADEAAGRKWMEKAVAAKSVDAMNNYGLWLHNSGHDAKDWARGVELSVKAADEGDPGALNNAAWMLCVSARDSVRKPAEGLALARKLEALPDIGPGAIDTIAACHAAAGDAARAVALQQRVVEDMKRLPEPDRGSLAEMEARLALYRAGKPYIEPLEAR